MLLKTILNTVGKHKSFVYSDARWSKQMRGREIEFDVQPRKNTKPICSGCGRKRPGYDRLAARRFEFFEFVPLWAIPVFLVYALRRINCPQCGVVVERVPWASGKNQQTNSYRMFLATWAKRISWQEVATAFGTSWDSVFRAVRWVVEWGIAHQDLTNITSIGIDEIQYRRGHKYLTLVYQLDEGAKRLLYVARDRTEASLNGFFNILSESTINGIQFACTDMLPAYLKVLKARASQALNILDRFHIMKKFGEAIDKVRSEGARQMKEDGYEELLKYNLRSVKAHLMREDFNRFWPCPLAIRARREHGLASFCVSGVCEQTVRRSNR